MQNFTDIQFRKVRVIGKLPLRTKHDLQPTYFKFQSLFLTTICSSDIGLKDTLKKFV